MSNYNRSINPKDRGTPVVLEVEPLEEWILYAPLLNYVEDCFCLFKNNIAYKAITNNNIGLPVGEKVMPLNVPSKLKISGTDRKPNFPIS